MDGALVVPKGAGRVVRNVRKLARIPPGIEGRNRRTVEKIGRRRIGRPFGAWKLKPSRACDRGVLHIAGDRDAVRVQSLLLKGSQELIGERDLETVLSAIGVLALAVDGRLVVELGLACQDERPGRRRTGSMVCVDMNLNGAPVALLAGPTENIILVAFVPDVVDDTDHRAGGRDTDRS